MLLVKLWHIWKTRDYGRRPVTPMSYERLEHPKLMRELGGVIPELLSGLIHEYMGFGVVSTSDGVWGTGRVTLAGRCSSLPGIKCHRATTLAHANPF